jgi:hypothetical protein
MQLSRKGPTTGLPVWLLATVLVSFMARIALQQSQLPEGGMQLISWHYLDELEPAARHQSKPVLLFFPGVGSSKSDQLERTVLTNPLVAKTIVDNFYPVRVEERSAKDFKEIKRLHLKYYLAQVPALLVAGPRGSKLALQVGTKSAAETYEFLKSAPTTEPANDADQESGPNLAGDKESKPDSSHDKDAKAETGVGKASTAPENHP